MLLVLCAGLARAEGDRAGAFDYYVLALSWTPNWCAAEGEAEGSAQCAPDTGLGWTLHGLWPQHDIGWPSWCRSDAREPTRRETAAMADIMGSSGLAWHQWRKHGRCTGLDADGYFALSRRAYGAVTRPEVFRALDRPVRLPARVVEEAFLEANPGLSPDMLTVTCRDDAIAEVRLCLTRDLVPRRCGADVVRDCAADRALFAPLR